jgi:hypothetical protein
MMKRFGIGLLYGIGGYCVSAVAGYFLVLQLSSNSHDRDLEAAMTGAFVFGPIAAIIAFVVGAIRSGSACETPRVGEEQ